MKKWYSFVIAAVVFMALMAAIVTAVYNYVVTPRYIEPLVEQVSEQAL